MGLLTDFAGIASAEELCRSRLVDPDLDTWWRERIESFVRRRREREEWRSAAALKGAQTKRRGK